MRKKAGLIMARLRGLLIRNDDIPFLLLLLVIWTGMATAVNPLGEFPLNDDWSYTKAVKDLVETQTFRLTDWTAVPLAAQILWGYLFCIPYGFSFTALRISVLTLGLLGVFFTYWMMREETKDRTIALTSALLIATNPIYFGLSNTFMTDVPFFSLGVLACYLLIKGLRHDSLGYTALGIIVSAAATLVRQTGLIPPVAFALVYIIQSRATRKATVISLLSVSFVLATLIGYEYYLKSSAELPIQYNAPIQRLTTALSGGIPLILETIFRKTFIASTYLGLFLLPYLIHRALAYLDQADRRRRTLYCVTIALATGLPAAVVLAAKKTKLMPYSLNILTRFGVGPETLRDVYLLHLPNYPELPSAFWLVVTLMALVGSGLLLTHLVFLLLSLRPGFRRDDGERAGDPALYFVLAAAFFYFAPMSFSFFLDRYFLFLIPLLLVTIFRNRKHALQYNRSSRAFLLLYILASGVFSVAATHDYLAWNRARWRALDFLQSELKISPERIDGGFEFNGWYFRPRLQSKRRTQGVVGALGRVRGLLRRHRRVHENQAVSFSPMVNRARRVYIRDPQEWEKRRPDGDDGHRQKKRGRHPAFSFPL